MPVHLLEIAERHGAPLTKHERAQVERYRRRHEHKLAVERVAASLRRAS